MVRILGRLVGAVVVLCSIAALYYYFSLEAPITAPRSNGNQRRPVKVLTSSVQLIRNDRVFEAVGTARSSSAISIYPAVEGDVVGVFFHSGLQVEKDQILVQLDERDEQLALELATIERGEKESLLNRYQQAGGEGAVPQSEVDEAKASFDAATVALRQAQLALDERQIRAPFAGVVGIPLVDPGDRVDRSTRITSLDDSRELHIDFDVPEQLVQALNEATKMKQVIQISTPAFPNQSFAARLVSRDTRINTGNRTLRARAEIDNKDQRLLPGMSFMIEWRIPGDLFPSIPEIALQWGRDGSYCWLIREGVAERALVQVIARQQGKVLVEGSLNESDLVVIEGVQRLRAGEEVEIMNERAS